MKGWDLLRLEQRAYLLARDVRLAGQRLARAAEGARRLGASGGASRPPQGPGTVGSVLVSYDFLNGTNFWVNGIPTAPGYWTTMSRALLYRADPPWQGTGTQLFGLAYYEDDQDPAGYNNPRLLFAFDTSTYPGTLLGFFNAAGGFVGVEWQLDATAEAGTYLPLGPAFLSPDSGKFALLESITGIPEPRGGPGTQYIEDLPDGTLSNGTLDALAYPYGLRNIYVYIS